MGISLLIGINPPKSIKEKIDKIRKYDPNNNYGKHEPHVTLYVNSFKGFSEIDKKLAKVLKKHKPFVIEISKLDYFDFDPILKSYTIIYKVEKNKNLSSLQNDIVDVLKNSRTTDQAKWLLKKNKNYPKKQLSNIKRYGYPFGPKDWLFHIGIGSYTKNKFNIIWKKAKKFDTKIKWKVNSISIYIHLGDDGFRLYKKYNL
jgi:hypothetical protein